MFLLLLLYVETASDWSTGASAAGAASTELSTLFSNNNGAALYPINNFGVSFFISINKSSLGSDFEYQY